MNRVHIKTYGCQMNERDSEAVAAMLRARGYRIVADEDECDVLLLNTCSVRDAAEQKAIGKAGYSLSRKKHNPDFVLGILGCMAQNRGAELLDRLPDVDLIVGTMQNAQSMLHPCWIETNAHTWRSGPSKWSRIVFCDPASSSVSTIAWPSGIPDSRAARRLSR